MAKIKGTKFNDVILPSGTTYLGHGPGYWNGNTFVPLKANQTTTRGDGIDGGRGDDYIDGGDGDDCIDGGDGKDILLGRAGNDIIKGGDGDDTLGGGLNSDELTGGKGADKFVYTSIQDSRATASGQFDPRSRSSDLIAGDTITDFASGTDKIDVAAIALTGGSLPAGFELQWAGLQASPVPANLAYGIWYQKGAKFTDVKADTNGDGIADLAIRLTGSKTLTASDFIGINSAPTITGGVTTGSVVEAGFDASQTPVGTDTATGTLTKTDPDADDNTSNDTWSLLATGTQTLNGNGTVTGAYGTLSVNQDGTWTYQLDNAAANGLALNETKTESFTVKVADAHGGYDAQLVTVTVVGSSDINLITGTATVLFGTSADDHIIGTSTTSPQNLFGLDGNDILDLPIQGGTANGNAGDDTLSGGESLFSTNRLLGGAGNDTLTGGSIDGSVGFAEIFNNLYGEADNDTLVGGSGDGSGGFVQVVNILDGGVGVDTLIGGNSSNGGIVYNTFYLGDLNAGDRVAGGSNAINTFVASATSGNDTVVIDGNDWTLNGQAVDITNIQQFTFNAGGGTDVIDVSASALTRVHIDLGDLNADDRVIGGSNAFNSLYVSGTSGIDTLVIDSGGWTLDGQAVDVTNIQYFRYSAGIGNDVIDASADVSVNGLKTLQLWGENGNDALTGGSNNGSDGLLNELVGDTFNMFGGTGGDDTLTGGSNGGSGSVTNVLMGDAASLNNAQGGDDSLTGGNNSQGGSVINFLYGDAIVASGSAAGGLSAGNDTLTGGSNSGSGTVTNVLNGDILGDNDYLAVKGGDDIITGGDNGSDGSVSNTLTGDAGSVSGPGGNDTLTGGSNTGDGGVSNGLYGDASFILQGPGGSDTLTGGSNSGGGSVINTLVGDGQYLVTSQGGDDTLTGGSNSGSGSVTNTLIGDASALGFSAQGGNDRLISGINATDNMYGDGQSIDGSVTGGADAFVFADTFGTDYVYDFHQDEADHIEFQVAGVASFSDLTIATSGLDTVITTSASTTDSVTLVGYDNTTNTLTASDFLFT